MLAVQIPTYISELLKFISKEVAMKRLVKNKTSDLKIQWKSIKDLKPYANNPRQHSEKQIRQIADSIETFGFNNPILLDGDNGVIAGHGRLEAAKLIGFEFVPTIYLAHMNEVQKRAYIIADNKLADNASWDQQLLKIEFDYLTQIDPDFDLSLTGFEIPEIDYFLQIGNENESEETLNIDKPLIPVTQEGNIWTLGKHKIFCGDSRSQDSYKKLLGDNKADLVFTDPPYNVPVDGHVCGNGSIKHREFAMASGEMSPDEFETFLKEIFSNLIAYSSDGSIHYICMDWRHTGEIIRAGSLYTELKNLCVWNKTNGGMGSLYRSKHELVFVFKNGKKAHTNNIQLGKHGRNRTNVWDYAGVNNFQTNQGLEYHPTVKPVALIEDAILDCSHRGQIVLDVFGGSGSTLLAAENCGRIARLIEIDAAYVDVTIERWQKQTGGQAYLESGLAYDDIKRGEKL